MAKGAQLSTVVEMRECGWGEMGGGLSGVLTEREGCVERERGTKGGGRGKNKLCLSSQ